MVTHKVCTSNEIMGGSVDPGQLATDMYTHYAAAVVYFYSTESNVFCVVDYLLCVHEC